ncbi:hypothetical protein [Rhizobium ecuadorense]|uniref:hypothetical protein n=1 Tax=Rhizobium ecuadorense TaxID=1671795 RepID=UPI00128F8624|nr:hypothetical protein [Rhizobium ecuadorense]
MAARGTDPRRNLSDSLLALQVFVFRTPQPQAAERFARHALKSRYDTDAALPSCHTPHPSQKIQVEFSTCGHCQKSQFAESLILPSELNFEEPFHSGPAYFPLRGLAGGKGHYTLILNDDSKRLGKLRAGYLR